MDWAATEGWNPGKYDFEVFWETDPDGFCGFYFEGELIAGGAIISYNNEYGFMGLFIVRPDFRGKGIGEKLWYLRRDLLKGRLLEGAVIGMDGVEAMQPFMKRVALRSPLEMKGTPVQGRSIMLANMCLSLIHRISKW